MKNRIILGGDFNSITANIEVRNFRSFVRVRWCVVCAAVHFSPTAQKVAEDKSMGSRTEKKKKPAKSQSFLFPLLFSSKGYFLVPLKREKKPKS